MVTLADPYKYLRVPLPRRSWYKEKDDDGDDDDDGGGKGLFLPLPTFTLSSRNLSEEVPSLSHGPIISSHGFKIIHSWKRSEADQKIADTMRMRSLMGCYNIHSIHISEERKCIEEKEL